MNSTRRNFLRLSAAGGVAAALGATGHGQNPAAKAPSDTGADFITAETEAAIQRGHEFLASHQNGDGSFAEPLSPAAVGITSLAGLALMAGGHMPGRGLYGRTVSKAVDFVLASGSRGARASSPPAAADSPASAATSKPCTATASAASSSPKSAVCSPTRRGKSR